MVASAPFRVLGLGFAVSASDNRGKLSLKQQYDTKPLPKKQEHSRLFGNECEKARAIFSGYAGVSRKDCAKQPRM
jgi:hypothetical protein